MLAAKAILLATLVLVGMIVSPVCAEYRITAEPLEGLLEVCGPASHALGICEYGPEKVEYNERISNLTIDESERGYGVQRISVDLPTGTTVLFTLWYSNGTTISGYMKYTNTGFFDQRSEVSIGSSSSSTQWWGPQEVGRVDIVGYAQNWTTDTDYTNGFIVYDSLFGVSDLKNAAYQQVPEGIDRTIYKFTLSSDKPLTKVVVWSAPRDYIKGAIGKTILQVIQEWISFAMGMFATMYGVATSAFYWIKFLFFDNLGMTVSLYLSISMAYSAATSKNIFKFFGKFFNDQRKLFELILSLWQALVSIIYQFAGIFKLI